MRKYVKFPEYLFDNISVVYVFTMSYETKQKYYINTVKGCKKKNRIMFHFVILDERKIKMTFSVYVMRHNEQFYKHIQKYQQ